MIINELLKQERISRYKLSKESGVAQSTIADICNGKTPLENCSIGTLYKISKALNVSLDFLMERYKEEKLEAENHRSSFEVFKSNVCHEVKDMGQIDFMKKLLINNDIQKYFDKGWQLEALYLLGMLDYLSRINDIPLCSNYNSLRKYKFAETIYPTGVLLISEVTKNSNYKKQALEKAIPEFLRFNIVESEIENVA